ncbi:Sulfotransferase family [Desulfosporosinus orientis DSM 765]|uniref:Sulfotransferase family n=1 Tax=Desulfosporosinus orientis (strain ATCC 19365 / DSM 765 / NCIMB 8382 / VKM B-1628 / Singapore I) TaxID=768706 RepID=G7WJR5_DESOD|nr:sulfotransferase family 2 domain-containing protein [Desulfosporosinus orientis]AET70502.1 Sulfotransferase family [Desulfosporosinus orientis DSM 765]
MNNFKLVIKNFVISVKNFIIFRRIEKREFIILCDKKLIYLVNSKVACSSIKKTFLKMEVEDNYNIHDFNWCKKNKLNEEDKSYYKFTFVRNPFDRLASCYESKYHKDKDIFDILHFDTYLMGILKNVKSFDEFVRKVIKIPDAFADRHFQSQYNLIFDRKGNCLVDYIGKYESISEEYKKIQQKYELEELPYFNKSNKKDWINYYTIETANLVYNRYKKDIEEFGYASDYNRLLEQLTN